MQKSLRSADYQRLVTLLVAARRTAGVSQQELADAIDQHQSFVAKYEGGQRRIDLVEFVTIARALEQDPVKLLTAFLGSRAQPAKAARKRRSTTS